MSSSTFGQETAEDVVRKMNAYEHGSSCKTVQKIEIIRPDWKREMTVKFWTKDGTKFAVMLIKEPVRDKGISYLKRSSEAWNWQPSIERTIKLPPSVMMQSWMGSDVTNDDMIKLSSIVVDYTHKFLKDTVIDSHPCRVIEALPKEDASVIWGKVELYITKDSYITLLTKSYDEDGKLVRIVRAHDIKQYGDRLHASWLEVIPKNKTGQKTITRIVEIVWDIPINENFFSILNLKKLE
jgi:hypothetical protein